MKVIIVGCGRVGARLATILDAEGHEVTIIDTNPESFRRLGHDFKGTAMVGVGIDQDVLRQAGIEQVDAFVATTNGDNTNVMACQIAKHIFKVPKVLARIYDPIREDTFHTLGLETFCPTTIAADLIKETLLREPARRERS